MSHQHEFDVVSWPCVLNVVTVHLMDCGTHETFSSLSTDECVYDEYVTDSLSDKRDEAST